MIKYSVIILESLEEYTTQFRLLKFYIYRVDLYWKKNKLSVTLPKNNLNHLASTQRITQLWSIYHPLPIFARLLCSIWISYRTKNRDKLSIKQPDKQRGETREKKLIIFNIDSIIRVYINHGIIHMQYNYKKIRWNFVQIVFDYLRMLNVINIFWR